MSRLFEAKSPNDVVLYQDDKSGNVYYYNGKELVYLYNTSPQIGDKGNKDVQDQEEQQRQAQRDQERAEAQAAKDAGEEYDEDALSDETAEERQQRIRDIQDILSDEQTEKDANAETRQRVSRSKQQKKADDLRRKQNSPIQRFSKSIELFIAKEVRAKRKSTWSKMNARYERSGIMRKGRRLEKNEEVPVINVYFDQSGSWDTSDVAVGMEALGVLKNYEDRKEIKVKLYYFADYVGETRHGIGSGTQAGARIIEHIQQTHPDNIIMMTDGDMDYGGWTEILSAPKVMVPGAVWFLFRNEASKALPEWIRGRKENSAFMI